MNITKLKVERLILAHEEAINSLEYIARAHPTATGSWQREDALKHAKESVEILRGLAEDAEPETAMIDAAMLAMKGICPPLRRSECRQLIRAAFNATSPQAPKDAEPVLLTKFNVTGAVPAVITPTVTFATTSPQAAQTALKSESLAQAAQAPARLPSEGKTIEALAPIQAAQTDERNGCLSNCRNCQHFRRDTGGHCYMFKDEPQGVCAKWIASNTLAFGFPSNWAGRKG